jgi:hypothetical protein
MHMSLSARPIDEVTLYRGGREQYNVRPIGIVRRRDHRYTLLLVSL